MNTYSSIIKRFKKKTILVVGDLILDIYIKGHCSRIAPEASVPVIDIDSKSTCLGGAANVAANLKAMGAKVFFCSVTGVDEGLYTAKQLLEDALISTDLLVSDELRRTLIKTRVSSTSQTIVRYDEGTISDIKDEAQLMLIEKIKIAHSVCDAILIADYGKGVLNDAVLLALDKLQQRDRKFLAVDAKNLERYSYLKPDLIKPNYQEVTELLSLKPNLAERIEQIQKIGKAMWEKTKASISAVSLDEEGVCLFERENFLFHIPAKQVTVPRVSGAGDTFISAYLLAAQAEAGLKTATIIASAAAAVAIQKENTAICSHDELMINFQLSNKIVMGFNIKKLCDFYRAQGKRIVFTNGCFDVLHSGHVSYLKGAKEKGDILIVGLNNDGSVRRLKGTERPINTLNHRIEVLAELTCIDHVISFGNRISDTPIELIKKIKPNVFVKGADYKKKFIPELQLLKDIGADVILLPFVENQSTTQIISRIRSIESIGKIPLSS